MNPFINQAAQRMAPLLQRMLQAQPGRILGLGNRTSFGQDGLPEVDVGPVVPRSDSPPQVPISGPNGWQNANGTPYNPLTPQQRINEAFGVVGANPLQPLSQPRYNPAVSALPEQPTQSAVPMPAPRPTEAPAAEDMPWWQRNANMQTDEAGNFLDPSLAAAAQQANVTGPALIQKFMKYFHNKPT